MSDVAKLLTFRNIVVIILVAVMWRLLVSPSFRLLGRSEGEN